MKVAVIGSTGVLGRILIPVLLQSGHLVRAVARSAAKAEALFPEAVRIVEYDLLAPDSEKPLRRALAGCEAAIHIATAIPRDFSAPHAWDANTRLRTDSVRTTVNIAIETGVRRYLQMSITMAYPGHGQDWIDESLPLDSSPERADICAPVLTMEQLVQAHTPETLEWCILRGGEFVGPGTFQERTIKSLKSGKTTVLGDGSNYVSLVHVTDMARAMDAALTRAAAGSIFNVVDKPLKQGEYLDRLATSVGADKPKRDKSAQTPLSWRCSNQAARSVLGWSPVQGVFPI